MLLTSDSSFLFHIAELEIAARLNLPLVCVVGVDYQWGLEVGVYKRTFGQGIARDRRALEQGRALRQDRRGLRLPRRVRREGRGHRVRRSSGLTPAAGPPSSMSAIDPKANSEEMPKYDEFSTWYAEGTQ